jgi:hypothetical protein
MKQILLLAITLVHATAGESILALDQRGQLFLLRAN